jgi:hypothetical protein
LGESENLSENGILFATDSVIPVGAVLEILLEMPEMISGQPTNEWLYSGHVVRVEPTASRKGHFAVGVKFDCYELPRQIEARPTEARPTEARPN